MQRVDFVLDFKVVLQHLHLGDVSELGRACHGLVRPLPEDVEAIDLGMLVGY